MKHLLIIFFFFSLFNLFGQDSLLVEIEVRNKREGETIQNVEIVINMSDSLFQSITNFRGRAYFILPSGGSGQVQLKHHSFIAPEQSIRVPVRSNSDTIRIIYFMEFVKIQDVAGLVINPPGVAKAVYQSNKLHVADFEINNGGELILLTYSKRLKKGSELLLYDGKRVKNSFDVPGIAEELIRDYRGNPHVVCEQMVYGIHVSPGQIGISTLPKEYYMAYLAPIVDTNKSKMYFSNFNPDYPAFEYFSYDQLDSTYRKIMHIEDDLMMELYRAEYKWADVRTKLWALNKEIETGVDAEIWVGANYFTQSIYYKELYAPMFHRNDTLFVFDYYKDKLFTYDQSGEPIDSVGIYHHYNPRSTGWKKKLIQDRVTGEIYAVFERGGYSYVGRVNTSTGEISEQVRLEYRYVDKIEVYGNHVYYVYREFESVEKRSLYRERLPYEFKEAKVPNGDSNKL